MREESKEKAALSKNLTNSCNFALMRVRLQMNLIKSKGKSYHEYDQDNVA